MANRPYFRLSIDELEKLFESSKGNRALLIQLDEELSNRDRPRAKALAKKVADCLGDAGSTKVWEHLVSPMRSVPKPDVSSGSSGIADVSTRADRSSNPPQNSRTNPKPSPTSPVEQERVVVKPSPFPRTVDFGDATSQFALEVETKPGPDSVLAAWLTLEVLTPQALPNARELESIGRALVRLEEYPEPWKEQRYWRRGKERTVHWMVYLGELDLEKATKAMLNKYPDEAIDERADVRGNTTLAVMVVDNQGRPAEGKTFLSSFAWGYGQVRAGRLKGLAAFPEAERAIKMELEKRLVRQNEEGEILPLSYGDIQATIDWLIKVLNLPEEEVIRPGIAIRVPQWGLYNEPPEPEILNSFFITDLAKTREAFDCGDVGKALSAYMGVGLVRERQNVVYNKDILAKILTPARMPLTRWPSPGRHPLVLMQQAAVNHSVVEIANGGMVAVNGPPGTGKTTLLRDIVSKVVLDRAIAMSKFDKPVQAFTHVAQMMTGRAYTHLYKLDESLIGHEIVAASSNNKAVENISREIPASKAMASDLTPQARYFQSISDAVAAGKGPIKDGATWGLAAAVLGNSSNRSAFTQSFYWHKKRGMARYLKAILGGDAPEDDEEDGEEGDEPRLLDVVTIEQPPRGEIEALERWRIARHDFLAKLKNAEALQKQAQAAYEAVIQRPEAVRRVADTTCTLQEAKRSYIATIDKEGLAKRLHAMAVDAERKAAEDCTAIDRLRPGFFARLFNLRSYREWRIQMAGAYSSLSNARMQLKSTAEVEQHAAMDATLARRLVRDSELKKQEAEAVLAQLMGIIEALRPKMRANLADEDFWNEDDGTLQLKSPWIFEEWQQSRDSLFVSAFSLHRAFIDAAAKPLRHNLRAVLGVMNGRSLKEQQESARRSLWACLFLVVPVVSTTFASTARLFGELGKEQLGWLLIDEAGQAMPQAAVGAIWRAERTIVIGDPQQIPPVVTTPAALIRSIFSEFGVDTDKWAAPEMSAQILADRISWFGTEIKTDDGEIWIGLPLRVHRRCENPMFKISNHVAYNGLMVYGTQPGSSQLGASLGDNCWINVEDNPIGKWSEAEGEQALNLLRKLMNDGIEAPDIFFVTPFRIIANKLRELICSDRSIAARLSVNPWDWTRDRVGTVHTFQGKEADTVVIVLGAGSDNSVGARLWAGRPPNLLNVAVTRAKHRLYVIGNRDAWKDAGAFAHLAQNLPLGRPFS